MEVIMADAVKVGGVDEARGAAETMKATDNHFHGLQATSSPPTVPSTQRGRADTEKTYDMLEALKLSLLHSEVRTRYSLTTYMH